MEKENEEEEEKKNFQKKRNLHLKIRKLQIKWQLSDSMEN